MCQMSSFSSNSFCAGFSTLPCATYFWSSTIFSCLVSLVISAFSSVLCTEFEIMSTFGAGLQAFPSCLRLPWWTGFEKSLKTALVLSCSATF